MPIGVLFMLFLPVCVNTKSLNDTRTLVKDLLKNYDKNVRPVDHQDSVVNVSVVTYLKSIQEFDEVSEVFAFTGAFTILWHDAGMAWSPDSYGGVDEVMISYRKVWVPDLVLTTPSDEIESFGKPWQMVKYESSGHASWTTGGLMKSTCSVDVGKYPFDKQACKADFNVWGYDFDEVEIYTISDKVDTSLFTGNVAWVLDGTHVQTTRPTTWSQLEVTFYLQRKASFVVVNILMPILFLSLINVFVFLLIPESGERVSYCITVLLSIAVFMTIISDTLPRSSEPLPIISYKLMLDMIVSSLITFVTVLNLRLYYRDDKKALPGWLSNLYLFLYRPRQKPRNEKRDTKVHPEQTNNVLALSSVIDENLMLSDITKSARRTSTKPNQDPMDARLESLIAEHDQEGLKVTWRDISVLVDFISLVLFTVISALSFGIFLLYASVS